MSNPTFVWASVNYRDAPAAITFLTEAFGFVSTLVVTNPADASVVEHAELLWPEGGGIMLGSAGRPDNPFCARPTGAGSTYVVTDDPHGVYAKALAGGATLVKDMTVEDYGSTGFTVTDPEGNLWSFGTYRGEPLP
jgi:uncharacterized glyoxalase superfamily protein PhnB